VVPGPSGPFLTCEAEIVPRVRRGLALLAKVRFGNFAEEVLRTARHLPVTFETLRAACTWIAETNTY